MPQFMLSEVAFESLLRQLVDFEEGRNEMVEAMFRGSSQARDQFVELLDRYIARLDGLVRNAGRSNEAGRTIPFVTIHSEVDLTDLQTGETLHVSLINPFDSGAECNEISFVSPMGRAMLMREPGDEITVNAPGGMFPYRILAARVLTRPYHMALSR